MLCGTCEQHLKGEPRVSKAHQVASDGSASLRLLLCERCGVVLPQRHPDDDLLKRLTQFARFGIGAGSGPLLSRKVE